MSQKIDPQHILAAVTAPTACVRCGAVGLIQLDHFGRTMRCPACQAKFRARPAWQQAIRRAELDSSDFAHRLGDAEEPSGWTSLPSRHLPESRSGLPADVVRYLLEASEDPTNEPDGPLAN